MDYPFPKHEVSIDIPDDNTYSFLSSLDVRVDDQCTGRRNSIQAVAQPIKMDPVFKVRSVFVDLEKCNFSSPTDLPSSTLPSPSFTSYATGTGDQRQEQQKNQQKHKQQVQRQKCHPLTKHLEEVDLQLSYSLGSKVESPDHVLASENRVSMYENSEMVSVDDEETLRFIFYHPDTGRLYGKTLFDLCGDTNLTIDDLLKKENHWLDLTSPTPIELHSIGEIFGIHPLTIEDITQQEVREKCDSFRNYLFVSYRAFIQDDHVLKPVNFYNVVFKQHLLTIHFGHVPHVDYVQRRVEQLRGYMTAIPDWINYAVVDEVTDSFAPLIHQIEHEVENLDEIVLWSAISTPKEQTETVSRIGLCRKRVMQMLRLLSSKSDVIRALIKRFEERSGSSASSPSLLLPDRSRHPDQQLMSDYLTAIVDSCHPTAKPPPIVMDRISPSIISLHQESGSPPCPKKGFYTHGSIMEENGQIFPDVALYLGDVQDHILSMLQNLNHYETLLARTHANYLAKISIELSKTSNLTNVVIGRLTIFATIIVPMNLVTGIWGEYRNECQGTGRDSMHQELTEATNFMGRLLQSKLDPSLITIFTDKLYGLLSERFVDHWDVDCPYRGNAYRAISIFNGQLDPLLALAAQEVSIPPAALLVHLPQEFVLWIDPSSVSYRVGDHGNIMDLYINGKSLKDRKSMITNAASTSTPIRISPPTSPAAIEKKLQQQHHQQHQPLQPSSPLAIHAKREQQKQKQQQSQQQPTTPRHKSLVLAH